ncbi:MAG: alanine racemase [Anaerolineae bacterium]|nr:alanine racemase [Anaerolineae bacterium]
MTTNPPADGAITYAVIDLSVIMHNVRALKAHVGGPVEVIAVVKANGYGHGAAEAARAALAGGATRLAVARVDEGVALRQAGLAAPILVMGYAPPDAAPFIVAHNLTATLTTWEAAQAVSAQAEAAGRRAPVHVKVDTGMGRFGLLPEEAAAFVDQVAALPGLDLEGMFTHFAVADEPAEASRAYTRQQFARFTDVLRAVAAAGHRLRVRHCANSAATLFHAETHLDAVRPGIAIYGLRPNAEVAPPVALQPALALQSRVARVRTLPPGSSISYGRTYTTTRPTPVALVPVGYGDGYHRLLSNRGAVLINGQRAPIVGRVCMDQFVVDVTGIPDVKQDDTVVLIGAQGEARITAEEVARWAETINYEVTTSLLPRVKRVYLPPAADDVR